MMWRYHIPEWMPFACLITNKVLRKGMITRILEALIISFIAALGGGYLAVTITQARTDEKLLAVDHRVTKVEATLTSIDDCLRNRTCTK